MTTKQISRMVILTAVIVSLVVLLVKLIQGTAGIVGSRDPAGETGGGGTLENPVFRVPKVQGGCRISQAKGQSGQAAAAGAAG